MRLETERLVLRRLQLDDLDWVDQFVADAHVMRWIGSEPSGREVALEHLERWIGYATEAALAVREWAYANRSVERLISLIQPENERSVRVAQKLGARPEQQVDTPQGPAVPWVHPR